jgi:hypothetical protein
MCRYFSLNARTGTLVCVRFEIFVAVKIHLKMKAAISSLISVPICHTMSWWHNTENHTMWTFICIHNLLQRLDGLYTRKFRDNKDSNKIAVTLPNRRMQPHKVSPVTGEFKKGPSLQSLNSWYTVIFNYIKCLSHQILWSVMWVHFGYGNKWM